MKYLLVLLALTACTVQPQAPIGETLPVKTEEPLVAKPAPEPLVDKPAPSRTTVEDIKALAAASSCYKYQWKNRGQMPKGYAKGVALTFARAVCHLERPDVGIVSASRKLPESSFDKSDALSWYNSNFAALGLYNDEPGVDTLRHAYALLLGLGLRESSGRYCCGRDMSANFSSADSAEAGLFQSSWGARRVSPELSRLFDGYKSGDRGCLLAVFKEGSSCSSGDLKNWGTGDGFDWQKLTKECPAFATEYAAILLRLHGGTKGEFGPLRTKAAELRPECDSLLKQVQQLVGRDKAVCDLLDRVL